MPKRQIQHVVERETERVNGGERKEEERERMREISKRIIAKTQSTRRNNHCVWRTEAELLDVTTKEKKQLV